MGIGALRRYHDRVDVPEKTEPKPVITLPPGHPMTEPRQEIVLRTDKVAEQLAARKRE